VEFGEDRMTLGKDRENGTKEKIAISLFVFTDTQNMRIAQRKLSRTRKGNGGFFDA